MKKKLALILVLALVLSMLAACTDSTTPTEKPTEKPTEAPTQGTDDNKDNTEAPTDAPKTNVKIAYVSGLLTNEIFAMQVEAMEKYSKEIGVEFLNTPCADDAAKISAIENYIQAGVDVIICHVSTVAAMEDPMKQAQAAGIKFFAYDTPIPGCDAFFGWDNYEYGKAIGENAVEWINKTFSEDDTVYCYSANFPTADFLVVRESGYVDAINEGAKCKIEWAGAAVGGSTVNGVTAGENWLQNGKPINLVVGINDAGCLGVLEAFNAAGKTGDDLAIFAGDATSDAIAAMMKPDSIYRGTVLTGLVSYAPDFIDICVKLANGEQGAYYYGGTWFITPENVEAYSKSNDAADLKPYGELRSEPLPG